MVWIYNLVGGDMGLAIIVLTVVIKLALYPFSQQSLKSQRALQKLQPQVEELKKRLKDQKDKMAQELMRLYQRERVSPLSSCLPLLIQLPFLIALFQVFRSGLNSGSLEWLYPFIANPGHLNDTLFGMWHLAGRSIPLAILYQSGNNRQRNAASGQMPHTKQGVVQMSWIGNKRVKPLQAA